MKVGKDTHYNYSLEKSLERLDSYLSEAGTYQSVADIPSRDSLTFTNGYYVNCYAIFVDIRGSSKLTENHQARVLAKLYRSYISELVAILQSYNNCREVNIVGDCVSAIFSFTERHDVIQVVGAAAQVNSIVEILNYKLYNKGYKQFEIGIGIAKGKALMIKAGYNGSGINDVVWMGDVVNTASNLCNIANKRAHNTKVIVIEDEVYNDLDGELGGRNHDTPYQSWFSKVTDDAYTGNIHRINMNDWLEEKETSNQRLVRQLKR